MPSKIQLADRPVPIVNILPPIPLPVEIYHARLWAAAVCIQRAGYDVLAIYGDREHSANMAYLTGFDPRFEEALLLLGSDGRTKLLVGNECMGYTPDPVLNIDVELFQEFSLLGQPRGESRPLKTILSEFGLTEGVRVGAVGWKYFDGKLIPADALDIPAYLAETLRDICGAGMVRNATTLFMDAQRGLRITNEPAQIAQYEHAASVAAAGVMNVMTHLANGVAECELERYLDSRGLTLSCHRMINAGDKVKRGLSSASTKEFKTGESFVVAFGVTGALTCRAGCVGKDEEDLSEELRDFYPKFASNYFDVISTWYESLRLGVTGGEVYDAVEKVRNKKLYNFAVNPGHQLHLDEWVNSPFSLDNPVTLESGMALQMDIIPVSAGPFCYINAEDGIVLADEELRTTLEKDYPEMWARMQNRRAVMRDNYGINLDESVLPLSDLAGWLPPYALNLSHVFVKG
ncbi:MAG: hypothetical protein WCO98_09675 [bacterium]